MTAAPESQNATRARSQGDDRPQQDASQAHPSGAREGHGFFREVFSPALVDAMGDALYRLTSDALRRAKLEVARIDRWVDAQLDRLPRPNGRTDDATEQRSHSAPAGGNSVEQTQPGGAPFQA